MAYTEPNVPLIPQQLSLACWYASAQMLIQWRQEFTQSCEIAHPDPSMLPDEVNRYKANNGLDLDQMMSFAKALGLQTVPPMTPTLPLVEQWVRQYGPVWAAGKKINAAGQAYGHAMVIVGVKGNQLYIHDPEPMKVGSARWVDESWLTTLLSLAPTVMPTNFMYVS
jgi:ABC-type bacteriocin/lantibiotic exporter with double-glycine peptidase domain